MDTLPNPDSGSESNTSRRSGSLNLAISKPARNVTSSSNDSEKPGRSTTQAHIRSPSTGSGYGTQATLSTAWLPRMRFSTSSALIFSPPRLIRSLTRPSTT